MANCPAGASQDHQHRLRKPKLFLREPVQRRALRDTQIPPAEANGSECVTNHVTD